VEKPWLAAVDAHAIGGGCQLLLVMDYVVAERGSILTLPARREGIIPGAANLRLARFIGDRAARRTLLMDQPIPLEGDTGRRLVDEVVAAEQLSRAVQVATEALLSAGTVSLAAHRKALRIAQEPVQQFREYMSHFALAQADCHFSPALLDNLERNWLARGRHRATALPV
jgi:thioesterase DpgC